MVYTITPGDVLLMGAFKEFPLNESVYVAYGTVMFFILCLGLAGNLLSIPVLLHRDHRKKSVTPLMLNMCVVDILLCSIGYSISISYNLVGKEMEKGDHLRCGWIAFINCFTGIVGIATLTLMSYISYAGITTISIANGSQGNKVTSKSKVMLVAFVWIFSLVLSIPPAFGWNSFVPFENGISCHPDWVSQDPADRSYIILLVLFGFFMPLVIILVCYSKTYCFIRGSSFQMNDTNQAILKRQMETQRKMLRMTIAAVTVFFLSWAPYCFISIMATAQGKPVISGALSLVPELMAKSSVVFNPMVYTFMNAKFRLTLMNMLKLNYNAVSPSSTFVMENTNSVDDASLTPAAKG